MTQITLPLNIKSLEVLSQDTDSKGNIVLKVRSTNDHSTCHGCVALTALLLIWYAMRCPLNGATRNAQHQKNAVSVGCDPGVHPMVCSLRVKLSES